MADRQSSSEQIHVEYTPDTIQSVSSAQIHVEYMPDSIQYISSILLMIEYIPTEQLTKRRWQII